MSPPAAGSVRHILRLIENVLRTIVIGHVDHEIGDSRSLECIYSSLNITWELIVDIFIVSVEGTDDHLNERRKSVVK